MGFQRETFEPTHVMGSPILTYTHRRVVPKGKPSFGLFIVPPWGNKAYLGAKSGPGSLLF